MKVRIKKRTNELFALKPPGSKKKKYNIINEDNDIHKEAIGAIGFNNIEYISKGMFGSVYKGTWDEYDGVEHAIKVLPSNGNGKYEAKVYRTISDARKENKLIAKHFPRVDMIRYDQERNLVLIVMELLEADPNAKAVIQDIFGQGEVGFQRTDLALQDMDVLKDVSRRASLMISDPKTKEMIVDKMIYYVPTGGEYVKKVLMSSDFRNMKFKQASSKWRYATGKMIQDSKAMDLLMTIIDDMRPDGWQAMSFIAHFLYASMQAWDKDFDSEYSNLFEEIEAALEDFIHMYRNWTPVGISPMGIQTHLYGAPPETKGAGYPGAESILNAIKAVRNITGLGAQDMHDQNVLVRPSTKDLIIVDVGLFQQKSTRKKSPDERITALEQSFPHGGQPHGASRKQNPEKEHAGHVERSKYQGLKNVMDEIIDEEIDAVLNERCQKGYKTHPTRKTKKMYGKTYRNCVKAEAQVEEVYSDKQRRYMCAMSKQGADRPEGLSKAEAEEMCKGPMKEADPKKGTGKKPKDSGRRLYTDEDPSDTVSVKFSTVQDIKDTLSKDSFKSKSHKRQSQIINLIHQRVRAAYQNAKDPKTKARLKKAFDYAKKRKEASKEKTKRMQKNK